MQRALGTAKVWNIVVKGNLVHGGRLKFTLMCTFLVKAESGGLPVTTKLDPPKTGPPGPYFSKNMDPPEHIFQIRPEISRPPLKNLDPPEKVQ